MASTARRLCLECLMLMVLDAGSQISVPGYKYEAYAKRGDINIAMMTYIHRYSSDDFCSEEVLQSEALRSEVARYVVNSINEDDDLLPNVTVGFVVLDGCLKDLTALAAALFLVDPPASGTTSGARRQQQQQQQQSSIIGLVGPTTSRQAVMVSSLLGLFHIPTLSPSASSDELSDKKRYAYFSRLVPPDRYQAAAILDIVRYLGWSYVSLLYSEGSYGENGARNVHRLARSRGVCLAVSRRIPTDAGKDEINELLRGMAEDNKLAPAVVVILEGHDIYRIFKAVGETNLTGHFRWIGSDSFWTIKDTGLEDAAVGALYIGFPSGDDPGFGEYLKNVSWINSTNPWVPTAIAETHNCSWTTETNNSVTGGSCRTYKTPGAGGSLAVPAVGKDIDGFMVYARAAHRLISDRCPELFRNDRGRDFGSCIGGRLLLEYMRNVTFRGVSEQIAFDDKGDMNGSYLIRQVRGATTANGLVATVVGEWNKGNASLAFEQGAIDEWLDARNVLKYPVSSVCSSTCKPGYYYLRREQPCCWDCIACREDEITANNRTACLSCPPYQWPDAETRSHCELIEPSYLDLSNSFGLLLLISGLFGASLAVALMVIYRMKKNNRLLKATSLELSSFIFVGCLLACTASTLFVVYPEDAICIMRHVGFHLAVTIIYAPLLAKTSRVYRIFRAGKKGTNRPKFISTKIQLLFTCTIILIQVAVLISLQVIWPSSSTLTMPLPLQRQVEVTCSIEMAAFLVPLTINMLVICACVALAFLTRKLPENFNDSHHIFVSTSTTTFMWSVFLPTHFTVGYTHHRSLLLALCLQVNAYVIMFVQYGPKVYATFWLNEHHVSMNIASLNTAGRVQQE